MSLKNPIVSIIVPVYNVEKYLRRCIDSILIQPQDTFELLLIDDGSPDESGKICDEYAKIDNRVRVFHQTNSGVSSARNVGIDNASGEWIVFVDSDDWVSEEYLKILMHEARGDLVYFGMTVHYGNHSATTYQLPRIETSDKQEIKALISDLKINEQRWCYFGYTWNKLFKKDIIKNNNIRFKPNLSIHEDELFTLQYYRYVKTLKTIPNSIYHYRILPSGLTSKNKTDSKEYEIIAAGYELNIVWLRGCNAYGLYLREIVLFYLFSYIYSKNISYSTHIARHILALVLQYYKDIILLTTLDKILFKIIKKLRIIGIILIKYFFHKQLKTNSIKLQ